MDIEGFRFGREVGRALRVVQPESILSTKADPTSFSAEPKPIWYGAPAVLNFADRPTGEPCARSGDVDGPNQLMSELSETGA